MPKNYQLVICLLGLPGSGKGTQAKLLSKKYNIPSFSMGQALRDASRNSTKLGQEISSYIDQGKLIPTRLMTPVLDNALRQINYKKGIIFDGMPRRLSQLKYFDQILSKNKIAQPKVFNLKITDAIAWERIRNRQQTQTASRGDDTKQKIINRIKWSKRETQLVINEYRRRGQLHEVDASQPINMIYQQIIQVLKKSNP